MAIRQPQQKRNKKMIDTKLRKQIFEIIDMMQDIYIPEILHGPNIYFEYEIAYEIENMLRTVYNKTGRKDHIKTAFNIWRNNLGIIKTTTKKTLCFIPEERLKTVKYELLSAIT
jgi:hypothetical protein